jgi:hypothetical protein
VGSNPPPAAGFVRVGCEHVFVAGPSFTEPQLREAIAASHSYKETMECVGLRAAGGNFRTIKKYAERWQITTDHFRPARYGGGKVPTPLAEVLVENSSYPRGSLKRRLFDAGLKARECELCGQTEEWHGRRMSLILDHANGGARDNRLENLRILCPNCNATLDTHCGKNKPRGRPPRVCEHCGGSFRARHADQRFCSQACSSAVIAPLRRQVERPPLAELLDEVSTSGYKAVGRRYGVSDNAVRKWIRVEGVEPPTRRRVPLTAI